jgi:flagellar protein FliL
LRQQYIRWPCAASLSVRTARFGLRIASVCSGMANEPAQLEKKAAAPSKMPGILGAAIVLLFLAGGAAAWYHHSKVQASNASPSGGALPAGVIHLDSFIVNLADQGQITYLRVAIDLGVDKVPESKESVPIASIRDAIIGVLATRHSEELLTPEGKQKLKQDLIAALDHRVPELGVRDIYFTDFLVQR